MRLMAKIKVVLNRAGVGALLKSEEMKSCLQKISAEISGRAGEGYAADIKNMGTRLIASVYTETEDAMRDNLDNNTILKALK